MPSAGICIMVKQDVYVKVYGVVKGKLAIQKVCESGCQLLSWGKMQLTSARWP